MRYTLLLLLLSCYSYAQTEYDFTVLEGLYEPLATGDTLTDGTEWISDDFDFETSFDISLLGVSGRKFRAMQGAMRMDTSINNMPMNIVASAFAMDLRSSRQNPARSPIILHFEGNPGDRVLTLEFRNAHFVLLNGQNDFVNFQIKYFEQDRSFEFHYGPSETDRVEQESNDRNIVFGASVGLALGDSVDLQDAYLLSGLASNPVVVRQNDILRGFPEEDVVFRFYPKTTANGNTVDHHCDNWRQWKTGNTSTPLTGINNIYAYRITGQIIDKFDNLDWQMLQSCSDENLIILSTEDCPEPIKVLMP